MKIYNKPIIIIYAIKGSTIKKIILFDIIVGTGLYFVVKIFASNAIIASIGSFIGTEGVKRFTWPRSGRIITVS
ncbi:hypothetical protein D3C85_1529620 [compost metagenome]